jgi:hypothetical protein
MPAGSANTATDSAGIVNATRIIVHPGRFPAPDRGHAGEHPDRHRQHQQSIGW